MSTPPPSTPEPPDWPKCGYGASPKADSVGCLGHRVPGYTRCLAHLTEDDRGAYLAGLTPGADIDHRGTPFDAGLLRELLRAIEDPATGFPILGTTRFSEATFAGPALFMVATFDGAAEFNRARFDGEALFGGARFTGDAQFGEARFDGAADFGGVTFDGAAHFDLARFTGDAQFGEVRFDGAADFGGVTFDGAAHFDQATFTGDGQFLITKFSGDTTFDRAQFARNVAFRGTKFRRDASFSLASFASVANFQSAEFSGDAMFRLAQFKGRAGFGSTKFMGDVSLDGAIFAEGVKFAEARYSGEMVFNGEASFSKANLAEGSTLGPCTGGLSLDDVRVGRGVRVQCPAERFRASGLQCPDGMNLQLDGAISVDASKIRSPELTVRYEKGVLTLNGAAFDTPTTITAGTDPAPRLLGLDRVDATNLTLVELNLESCRFLVLQP